MIHIASDNKTEHPSKADHAACGQCGNTAALDFEFDYAYQPIVDLSKRTIFAHEALVRGPNGESAYSVLSQVNDGSRYRFDQACRVKAVVGVVWLGLWVFVFFF